ncbi:hypothetical protein CEXT_812471 [Caerostris extrusa]|uniref:Uncharacterized protein n=1 Tax=Caerostris extrusa TaxID=172846 RepID=A0AAV4W0N4_CAEEX|nr:hypothetical protein CEXT_812471 [Caerostris extrusa]
MCMSRNNKCTDDEGSSRLSGQRPYCLSRMERGIIAIDPMTMLASHLTGGLKGSWTGRAGHRQRRFYDDGQSPSLCPVRAAGDDAVAVVPRHTSTYVLRIEGGRDSPRPRRLHDLRGLRDRGYVSHLNVASRGRNRLGRAVNEAIRMGNKSSDQTEEGISHLKSDYKLSEDKYS